jgi:uncharacterized cupin superfamily protein
MSPMEKIVIANVKDAKYKEVNINEIFDPNTQHKHSFEFQNSHVSSPYTGEGKLSVCFYTLQPGKANYPYHYHTGNEEVFYIINGQGTLRTTEGEKTVSEGDVIIMPANENGAHMLINTSDEPLVYIDIDTVHSPDVLIYPDSEKLMVMTEKFRKSFRLNSEVNYLDGE